MDNLSSAIHMLQKQLKDKRFKREEVAGVNAALDRLKWLQNKVEVDNEKKIEEYFSVDQRTLKIKRNADRYSNRSKK